MWSQIQNVQMHTCTLTTLHTAHSHTDEHVYNMNNTHVYTLHVHALYCLHMHALDSISAFPYNPTYMYDMLHQVASDS